MAAEDMRDDVVGFHAQQAVEKALRSPLYSRMSISLVLTISVSWLT
jgi:HEPN domain-containing protein